jgi:hypothetical protein
MTSGTVKNQQHLLNFKSFTAEDVKTLVNKRKIYVWGAGRGGIGFSRALERNGLKVEAFLDRSPILAGTTINGKPVLSPEKIIPPPPRITDTYRNGIQTKEANFIFTAATASDKTNNEMIACCMDAGLEKYKDFMNCKEISLYYPSVEISGVCNLRCIACPRSDRRQQLEHGGFMRAADYEPVIKKLVYEIPFLTYVDLFLWGEALLNPDVWDIIEINDKYNVESGISTNLNLKKQIIEKLVQTSLHTLTISASGYGEKNYEITHTGGKWKIFYDNLLLLRKSIDDYKSSLIPIVYYHVNKKNISEYKDMYNLCKTLSFKLITTISLPFSDYAFDFVNNNLNEEAKQTIDMTIVDFNEIIAEARNEHEKRCVMARAFPSINWDMSVFCCSNYSREKLAKNYLDISLQELIALHNNSQFCQKCIDRSLHRYPHYTKFNDYKNKLIYEAAGLASRL